jgi:hypothetical protein
VAAAPLGMDLIRSCEQRLGVIVVGAYGKVFLVSYNITAADICLRNDGSKAQVHTESESTDALWDRQPVI